MRPAWPTHWGVHSGISIGAGWGALGSPPSLCIRGALGATCAAGGLIIGENSGFGEDGVSIVGAELDDDVEVEIVVDPGGASNLGPIQAHGYEDEGVAPSFGNVRRCNGNRVHPTTPRRRGMHHHRMAELSDDSSDDCLEIDNSEESNGKAPGHVGSIGNQSGIKWEFRNETWGNSNLAYEPLSGAFSRNRRGPSQNFRHIPSFLTLFELFWTPTILGAIVDETNRYANAPIDDHGHTKGGPNWENLTIPGLKAFIAIALYMGLKIQPNDKMYWMQDSLFHCAKISSVFSRTRFQDLRRCLHVTNVGNIDRRDPFYDKIGQTRWLVEQTCDHCKMAWCLGKHLIVDEMMIRYKGIYSPIRQYMPKKPQNWGLKVWCLAYSISKYIWNFEFYCGKDNNVARQEPIPVAAPDTCTSSTFYVSFRTTMFI